MWKGEGRGRMANAPPPEAFQFTEMYWPDEEMRFVSHALFVTLTFSYPCSFLVGCPKTWRYLEALTKRDMLRTESGVDERKKAVVGSDDDMIWLAGLGF